MTRLMLICLFFILWTSVAEAVEYDCGSGSTLLILHQNEPGDIITINGQAFDVGGQFLQSFPCSGLINITDSDLDFSVSIIANPALDFFTENFMLGLSGILAGFMLGMAILKNS